MSLAGALSVDDGTSCFDSLGLIIPPDRLHRISPANTPVLALYLEPESNDYDSLFSPWLQQKEADSIRAIELSIDRVAQLRDMYAVSRDPNHAWSVCASALDMGEATVSPSHLDPRIEQVVEIIRREPNASHAVTGLARAVHLSPGRLSHLFRDEIGVAIRRFVAWVRIRQVVERTLDGESLTRAAHAAGFSDAAHMSNTFRQMFGFAPSTLFAAHIEKDIQLLD